MKTDKLNWRIKFKKWSIYSRMRTKIEKRFEKHVTFEFRVGVLRNRFVRAWRMQHFWEHNFKKIREKYEKYFFYDPLMIWFFWSKGDLWRTSEWLLRAVLASVNNQFKFCLGRRKFQILRSICIFYLTLQIHFVYQMFTEIQKESFIRNVSF